jgi:hypothetical protein
VHASGVVLAMLTLQFLPSFSSFFSPWLLHVCPAAFLLFFYRAVIIRRLRKTKLGEGIEHIKLEYAVP